MALLTLTGALAPLFVQKWLASEINNTIYGVEINYRIYLVLSLISLIAFIIFAIINMVISIKNRGKLSYTTILIFKIIQIPALILTAITTLLFLAGSFNPFLMVFIPSIIYNGYMYCFILILSSNLHTIFRLTENRNKDHSKYYIIHVIMQFIFLLDYIDTLYLAIKELYNKKIEKK